MSLRIVPRVLLMACLSCGWARAGQVTIVNPKHLPVQEAEVELLYTMVCQEIADTYHINDYKKLQVPLTLVLGDDERYTIDHRTGAVTVYLIQWDERHFAAAAVMIAFHHVLSNDQFQLQVARAVARFNKVRPESVTALRHQP